MKLFICILLLLFFLGCNYRTKLTFEMIKWQNKEIFIPQNLQAFIYGKDTIINYHNNKYNICQIFKKFSGSFIRFFHITPYLSSAFMPIKLLMAEAASLSHFHLSDLLLTNSALALSPSAR